MSSLVYFRDSAFTYLHAIFTEIIDRCSRLIRALFGVADDHMRAFLAGEVCVEGSRFHTLVGGVGGMNRGLFGIMEDMLGAIRGLYRDGLSVLVNLGNRTRYRMDDVSVGEAEDGDHAQH